MVKYNIHKVLRYWEKKYTDFGHPCLGEKLILEMYDQIVTIFKILKKIHQR